MSLLTRFALRARLLTVLLVVAVMVGGGVSLSRMQVELFPDIEFPLVAIFVPYPQNNPDEILNQVTIPLEKAFEGISGLESVTSRSSTGLATVFAEFELGTDMQLAASAVQNKLANAALPPEVSIPRVTRVSPDEFPILQFSILLPGEPKDLYRLISSEVIPALQTVPGVLSAEIPPGSIAGTSVTRTNGQPSLSVSILKEPDANTVKVAKAVQEKLDALKPVLPGNMEFITLVNQAPQIQASIESLQREATLGAVFAVIMIFIFLLSVRPTIVIAISIPASILGGLLIMGWQGVSLNLMTLGGLAISVGRVVDDSIVVLENVYKYIQRGGDRVTATYLATKEVAGPITVSTLTTIAVFVPLGFMGGIIGAFFLPFAWAITFALLASLVVALTVVPVLGSIFIRPKSDIVENEDTWIQKKYAPAIAWALRHKLASIGLSTVLFVASLGLLPLIPVTFIPSSGAELVTIDLSVPRKMDRDVILEEVRSTEIKLEALKADQVIETYQVTSGGVGNLFGPGGGGTGSANSANFLVALSEGVDGDDLAATLRKELNTGTAIARVAAAGGGGPSGDSLELRLIGENYQAASEAANLIISKLEKMDSLVNLNSDGLEPGSATPDETTSISRIDGKRAVTITGKIIDPDARRVSTEVTLITDAVPLPEGVSLQTEGVFADIDESFRQMGIAMLAGIVLVYLIMVVSMRSLMTPVVIVLSLPLASIGALGALYITQRALGLPSLIGLLMLIGLVVTNAIVLVSFVDHLRSQGMSIYDSLIEGGKARIRPILMTAFTTSFALLPLAVIVTEGTIIGAELATVVIGGLMTSTFLTLLVIPVIYSVLRRARSPKGIPEKFASP